MGLTDHIGELRQKERNYNPRAALQGCDYCEDKRYKDDAKTFIEIIEGRKSLVGDACFKTYDFRIYLYPILRAIEDAKNAAERRDAPYATT